MYGAIKMKRLTLLFLLVCASAITLAQTTPTPLSSFRIYHPNGQPATLADIVQAMREVEVVLIGEQHDDPTAHVLQATLLQLAYERYGKGLSQLSAEKLAELQALAAAPVAKTNNTFDAIAALVEAEAKRAELAALAAEHKPRPVVLAVEMFERDAQLALDEYLSGLIAEKNFREAARAWKNYESDYRPLVEFARTHGLAVVASNAPRRYVNRVSRFGPDALAALPTEAKRYLPPLPYATATAAYADKFRGVMNRPGAAAITLSGKEEEERKQRSARTLAAQSLWDATMAHSIAQSLQRQPDALVLHVNGRFHSEERMGISEHLARYRPNARTLIVTIISAPEAADKWMNFDAAKYGRHGDFVILTDPQIPRTYQAEESPRPKATASVEDTKHQ